MYTVLPRTSSPVGTMSPKGLIPKSGDSECTVG
jgi:hypothetical protein